VNFHKLCVFDLETDSSDPKIANPTQIAALMVNPRTLEIIPDSTFESFICPPTIGEQNYLDEHRDTIEWHARIRKTTVDKILELWKNAPSEKDVFDNFKNYLLKYHTKTNNNKSKFSAPIACGANIIRFDIPILQRLCEKYKHVDKKGEMELFYPRDIIDTLHLCFFWFENLSEPKSYNMDVLRPFLGLKNEGGHDALKDVKDTTKIIVRFLDFHRRILEKTKNTFKNAFKEDK